MIHRIRRSHDHSLYEIFREAKIYIWISRKICATYVFCSEAMSACRFHISKKIKRHSIIKRIRSLIPLTDQHTMDIQLNRPVRRQISCPARLFHSFFPMADHRPWMCLGSTPEIYYHCGRIVSFSERFVAPLLDYSSPYWVTEGIAVQRYSSLSSYPVFYKHSLNKLLMKMMK